METKHTPGPWVARKIHIYGEEWKVERGGERAGALIASLAFGSPGEMDADARLIAAAPDLLAAVEMAEDYIQHIRPKVPSWYIQTIKDAIAKTKEA